MARMTLRIDRDNQLKLSLPNPPSPKTPRKKKRNSRLALALKPQVPAQVQQVEMQEQDRVSLRHSMSLATRSAEPLSESEPLQVAPPASHSEH